MQVNGIRIETGTPEGDAIGFSEDLFSGWLEMIDNQRLYLHYVISRRKNEGNTQSLIRQWLTRGYDLRIVMPRPIMRHILGKFGFGPAYEYLPEHYDYPVEVWCREGFGDRFSHAAEEPAPTRKDSLSITPVPAVSGTQSTRLSLPGSSRQ